MGRIIGMARHTADAEDLKTRVFERLLERLGTDREAAATEYEIIRGKLLAYFGRRGAALADALADETLDRVARRIDEGEVIEHVRRYCYGVGRRVLLEWEKRRAAEVAAFARAPAVGGVRDRPDLAEARAACLERCLQALPSHSRELIVAYYEGPGAAHLEERKLLAKRLAISYPTLKTRAHRIRVQLEACLRSCLGDLRNR